jgi:hypothetical protein
MMEEFATEGTKMLVLLGILAVFAFTLRQKKEK